MKQKLPTAPWPVHLVAMLCWLSVWPLLPLIFLFRLRARFQGERAKSCFRYKEKTFEPYWRREERKELRNVIIEEPKK